MAGIVFSVIWSFNSSKVPLLSISISAFFTFSKIGIWESILVCASLAEILFRSISLCYYLALSAVNTTKIGPVTYSRNFVSNSSGASSTTSCFICITRSLKIWMNISLKILLWVSLFSNWRFLGSGKISLPNSIRSTTPFASTVVGKCFFISLMSD